MRSLGEDDRVEGPSGLRGPVPSSAMVCRVGSDGRWHRVPPEFCRFLGYTEEELLARSFLDVTHPDDRAASERFAAAMRRGAGPFEIEKRYLRKDGRVAWVHLTVVTLDAAAGGRGERLAIVRDLALQERPAILLHEQNRILERIARGEPRKELLDAIASFVDEHLPGRRMAILLAEEGGTKRSDEAARDLPSEPCWSVPLCRPDRQPLGTIALYDRDPTAAERAFVQRAAHLAELVLDRDRKDEALAVSEARYRSLFHSIDEGFCIVQVLFDEEDRPLDYRFLEVNPAFARHTGLRSVVGSTARELVPDLDASWFETYGSVARTGESRRFAGRVPAMERWFDTFAFRVGRPEDRQVALLFKDVTEQKAAEAELRENERRARTMADFRRSVMRLAEEGLGALNTETFYQRILDQAVQVIPGARAGALLLRDGDAFRFASAKGYDLEALRRVRLPEEAAGFGQLHRGTQPLIVRRPQLAPGLPTEAVEILGDAGKHYRIRAVLIVPIVVDEVVTAYLTLDNFEDEEAFTAEAVEMARVFGGHVASLVKRFALEEELHRLAYQDPLTRLPNRAMFREHLDRALDGASGAGTALMFVDLDNLKPINDSLGHPVGDEVLCAVADRLGRVAGEGRLVARIGGDEFTIVLSGRDAGREAERLAARILVELARPIRAGRRELHVSASIGVALHSGDGTGADDLLRHADIAMYHAKQHGKNGYAFFRPEMEAAPLERLLLEGALRRALEEDRFVLYFQPRIEIASGRVVCLEALVRWRHPERGLVPPELFVPLAEATNLIRPLGHRILEMALRQVRKWRDAGHRDLRVAVNLSARQLEHADFVDEVRELLTAEELAASALEFEVLESVALADLPASAEKLAALRALGVSIALDDFGAGYSSLSYLRDLQIDTIKIDRRFLHDLDGRASLRDPLAIVRAITQLGTSLDLTVVAEGVETLEQWRHLRAVGCHEAQGFLLARPMPASELEAVLEQGAVVTLPDVREGA